MEKSNPYVPPDALSDRPVESLLPDRRRMSAMRMPFRLALVPLSIPFFVNPVMISPESVVDWVALVSSPILGAMILKMALKEPLEIFLLKRRLANLREAEGRRIDERTSVPDQDNNCAKSLIHAQLAGLYLKIGRREKALKHVSAGLSCAHQIESCSVTDEESLMDMASQDERPGRPAERPRSLGRRG